MFHFYTPWKRQKTKGFLTFSDGIKMEHWTDMGLGSAFLQVEKCFFQTAIFNITLNWFKEKLDIFSNFDCSEPTFLVLLIA